MLKHCRTASLGFARCWRYSGRVADPRDALAAATRLYKKLETDQEAARQAVEDAVVAALRAGLPPSEVEQLSPFSSTTIRTIARKHKIPAATRGPRPGAGRR